MTKSQELSKQWAELEFGWTEWLGDCGRNPDVDTRYQPVKDFTSPDRFFAEVVPRLEELGYFPRFRYSGKSYGWSCFMTSHLTKYPSVESEFYMNIGEVGLEAAIKAREEIGK